MPAQKFLQRDVATGLNTEVALVDSSSGAPDAGKGVALDATGRLPLNMLPTGVGPELVNVVASENLAAGDFVNLHDVAGVSKARKADATDATKPANGFVKAGVTSGASGDVYFDGLNDVLTGKTAGKRYFLSATTPGAATDTPPSGSGNLSQILGVAVSATAIAFRPDDGTVLA
ncbi:MAG: hypothetical protein HQL90_14505 [Magnetococcales bacterium]|nr:hypothetical protein [Magnetococcales bacterium]